MQPKKGAWNLQYNQWQPTQTLHTITVFEIKHAYDREYPCQMLRYAVAFLVCRLAKWLLDNINMEQLLKDTVHSNTYGSNLWRMQLSY